MSPFGDISFFAPNSLLKIEIMFDIMVASRNQAFHLESEECVCEANLPSGWMRSALLWTAITGKTGFPPTLSEIARAVSISKATAYRYLVAMNESGMLSYDGKAIMTKQTEKCASEYFSAPVVGSIRCGDPELEEEWVEEYVSLPISLFGEGPFYVLRAKGDSMVDVGIEEGDLLVIRQQGTAEPGDVVVALDEENENTLKIFGGIDGDVCSK